MTRVSSDRLRKDLDAIVESVASGRKRLVLRHKGRDLAALVPVEDLLLIERVIEAVEDRIDVEEAERILRGVRTGRIKTIPWAEAKRRIEEHG